LDNKLKFDPVILNDYTKTFFIGHNTINN